jgi:hypothetical protein
VFRHPPIQHTKPQRVRVETDDIAIAKMGEARPEPTVEEWGLASRYRIDDEQIKGEAGDCHLDPDLRRVELIPELAAVENHLQGADRNGERAKAEKIEALAPGMTGLLNEKRIPRKAMMPTGRFM